MSKIENVTKVVKTVSSKIEKISAPNVQMAETSFFDKVSKLANNVSPIKKSITPEEVKELFVNGELSNNFLKDSMARTRLKLFFDADKNIYSLVKFFDSVNLKNKLTKGDSNHIADFMNMHDGKYLSKWYGYSDGMLNVEKLALFVRCAKRIEKMKFYKSLDEGTWENCIDGILNKPKYAIKALLEYKYDASNINKALSYGEGNPEIFDQIKRIEKFLNSQVLKNKMQVYRGEGTFGIFDSVVLDEKNNITLRNALETVTNNIESGKCTKKELTNFLKNVFLGQKVTQQRFMSTAIEPAAIEQYAQKVYWNINVPAKTRGSIIESYNVERQSEAEFLLQRDSQLLIKKAKYDSKKQRWKIWADLKQ